MIGCISREIRSGFLDFFAQNGHRIVPSSPARPGRRPDAALHECGMNQFKDVFLGGKRRDYARATSSQKCMRVSGKHNDLDNVGPVAAAPHLLRDARQLLVRRLLQGRGDRIRLAGADRRLVARARTAPRDRFQRRGGNPARRRGLRPLAAVPAGGPHRRTRAGRQLLADGRDGAVRTVLGDPLPPSGAALPARRVPRHRVRLRSLRRDLEQRVHGVRAPRRRRARPAARPVHRHGHGARAH